MTEPDTNLDQNNSKQISSFPQREMGILPSDVNKENIYIYNELKYFKNELLEEMKKIKQEFNMKFIQTSFELNEKIRQANESTFQLEEKIENISNNIDTKLEGFLKEINKYNLDMTINSLNNSMRVNDFKIEGIKLDLKNHIEKTDEMVKENLFYPGMIGLGCKYKNLKQFFDFIILSLSNMGSANNTRANEIKNYKTKTDSALVNIRGKISDITSDYKSYVNDSIKEFEMKFYEKIKYYEDKLGELKVQNIQGIQNIEQKMDTFDEKYENMKNIEKNINDINEKTMKEINENTTSKINKFNNEFQKDCKKLNNKIGILQNFNKELKQKLLILNTIHKKTIFFFKDEKDISNNNNNNYNNNSSISSRITSKIESDNTPSKKYKDKATETLLVNGNNITNGKENTGFNKQDQDLLNNVSNIYLEINKEKTGKNLDKKLLINKRLEKYKYIYDSNSNEYEDKRINKSVEEENTLTLEKKLNKNEGRINSSLPGLSARKNSYNKNEKNKVENYTSRKLYETGLFVNFNSKEEEKQYINNLKSNALCLKLIEKGITFDIKELLNKSSISKLKKDYYPEYKKEKEKTKEKKMINFGKKKKEKEKLYENAKIAENDNNFFAHEQKLFNRNSHNKIKIKNLSAII